jgi:hypothetical protein
MVAEVLQGDARLCASGLQRRQEAAQHGSRKAEREEQQGGEGMHH